MEHHNCLHLQKRYRARMYLFHFVIARLVLSEHAATRVIISPIIIHQTYYSSIMMKINAILSGHVCKSVEWQDESEIVLATRTIDIRDDNRISTRHGK